MNETNWDDLRLFLAVARGGGLARAAEETGKSAATLGRRMLGLERRLGQDLFRRLPRSYELTEDGARLLAQLATLEAQLQPVLQPQETRPLVKISAGIWVTRLLCQNIPAIRGRADVRLRFIAADEVLDIGRREAVIGVRNRRPDGVGLAGRRVTRVQFAAFAAGADVKPWVHVLGETPSAVWVRNHTLPNTLLEVTSPRNALDLAVAGEARVVLPTFVGKRVDKLQQVSDNIDALEHDQWLVTHHEDRFRPEVRQIIDRTYKLLRRECAL